MATTMQSWAVDKPTSSPFALPTGRVGRLAGWFLLWTNRRDQAELVAAMSALGLGTGDRVLEVGYGPGGLLRLLVTRTCVAKIYGVDPSPQMREMAARMARRAGAGPERMDLRVGTAEDTGLPDGSVDHVVAVNNVAIWPDLEAGLRELRRVLRPGGGLTIAWHGGSAPSRMIERLSLDEERLGRIERGLRADFTDVRRFRLSRLEVFVARR